MYHLVILTVVAIVGLVASATAVAIVIGRVVLVVAAVGQLSASHISVTIKA